MVEWVSVAQIMPGGEGSRFCVASVREMAVPRPPAPRQMRMASWMLSCHDSFMSQIRQRLRENPHVIWLALLTVALSVGWFLVDGDVKVNLADEGYIWYGVRAMSHGQVPMRDFHAYDPGRYFWTYAWSLVLGDDLVSMRLACVFFQLFGVMAGLLAARRLSCNPFFLTCIALMLCAWMHPRYKVFEQSIALTFVYAGVLLLEKPSCRRHFWVGALGGLMAFVGKNHGAYHVFAFALIIAWAALGKGWVEWIRRSAAWVGGMLLGFLPQWLMLLFVPGYYGSFMATLGEILSKGTNLKTHVPWPWLVPGAYTSWYRYSAVAEGCFYVAIPLLFLLATVCAWRLGRAGLLANPVFVAAVCVTLPYMHYVFSRADIVHLSHGAPTLVLMCVAVAFTLPQKGRSAGLVMATALVPACLLANLFQFGITTELTAAPLSLVRVDVGGQKMIAPIYHAHVMKCAQTLATELAKKDEPVLFLPHMPGLYPLTGRLSPTNQIYFIFPAEPDEDRALLAEIEAADVQWVMLHDYPLDGRDDLRFRNTNPIVFDFFRKNFEPVKIASMPPDMIALHRIQHAPLAETAVTVPPSVFPEAR